MTLKQLIKLEDKANEVWVISPSLHYDVENKDFSELVSVNLGQKTKYKYKYENSYAKVWHSWVYCLIPRSVCII